MYTAFYNLNPDPFRLTPDPRFFYASQSHKRSLYYLRYAFHQREGFGVITGAPGTGKTELMLNLISGLPRDKVILSKIVTSNLHANDLLELVGASFLTMPLSPSKGLLLKQLEEFFIERALEGKQILLLIDEAHNLSTKALIELSMLSNFQLRERPVLQCFLMGQEPLVHMLEQPELLHLKQRIIASAQLRPLGRKETQAYIEHRLRVAGWQEDPRFSASSFNLIQQYTGGVPRAINAVCRRLLLASYLQETHDVEAAAVYTVIEEFLEEQLAPQDTSPQKNLTLDFSDLSAAHDRQSTAPTDDIGQKEETLHFTTAKEAAKVIDVAAYHRGRTLNPAARLNLAPAWPDDEPEEPVTTTDARPSPDGGQGDMIPNNVHRLFKPQAHPSLQSQSQLQGQPAHEPDIMSDLVVHLPVEDAPILSEQEVPLPEQEPVVIDELAREHHRHLNDLRNNTKKSKTLRALFTFTKTGMAISSVLLGLLWWYLYGPGIDSTIQLLDRIEDLFR